MMIGYLFIRIDSVGLIYDRVDVNKVVPTFIDDIGDLRNIEENGVTLHALILLRNHSAFDINKGLLYFHRGGFVINMNMSF